MQSTINRLLLLALIFIGRNALAQQTVMTTVAGNGTAGFSGDGGQATGAAIHGPFGIAVDAAGNVYFTDWYNHRVRKVSASGVITTVAGSGGGAFAGDGGSATSASLDGPEDVAVDAAGNLYIADTLNNRVRKVDAGTGIIRTIAGTGIPDYNGEGPATSAALNDPAGLVLDSAGNLYIAEQASHRVRKLVLSTGIISTIAGTGIGGYNGDGGAATAAQLYNPAKLAMDRAGNLYIADVYNNRIRKVTPGGIISTVAGAGTKGFSGDGGTAASAQLNGPTGVTIDGAGNINISDTSNNRIRQVNAGTGIIRTIAGNDAAGCGSTTSSMNFVIGITTEPSGTRLYIADYGANLIRLLAPAADVPPTLTSIAPAAGEPGTAATVTFTGTGFMPTSSCSVAGATLSIGGTGVTAANLKVISGTSITATLTIAGDAALGARNINVVTASGPSNTRPFTVSARPVPSITSISPSSGLRGSSVSVTLAGTNFESGPGATSVAVNGTGINVGSISAVSATALTVTLTVTGTAPLGSYNVTVATAGGTSNAVTFAVNPPGPSITYGLPKTLNPTDQVAVQLALGASTPDPVTGTLTMTFTPDAVNNADDPNVTFINAAAAARTVTFTFPANVMAAQFSLPSVMLRAGTVAGTIRLTMTAVKVGGTNVSVAGSTFDVTIPRLVPVIASIRIVNRTAAGFDVEVTGYSTSRDITVATFQFAQASGATLDTLQLQPDVLSTFTTYYQSPDSIPVGSAFSYVQPFIVQQGDVNAVAGVTLTLTNAQGVSNPASTN